MQQCQVRVFPQILFKALIQMNGLHSRVWTQDLSVMIWLFNILDECFTKQSVAFWLGWDYNGFFFQLAQTFYLSIILSYPRHRFACFQKTILTLQAFGKLVDIFGHLTLAFWVYTNWCKLTDNNQCIILKNRCLENFFIFRIFKLSEWVFCGEKRFN